MSESLCAICEISAARVLRKDEGGFVAVPDDCVRPGHMMVVSARHEPSFAELSANDRRAYMSLVAETAAAVEKATGAERCYAIRIGDKFRHLHFHLVPRMDGEDGLAPFVFGDGGWRKGIRADATPPAELVEQAIAADLQIVSRPTPQKDPATLPAWLVRLAVSFLPCILAIAVIEPMLGFPWAGAIALGCMLGASALVDDRMSSRPMRWWNAAISALVGSAFFYWLAK